MPTTWSQFAAIAASCRTIAEWNHLASITPSFQLTSPNRAAVAQVFRQLCADPCSKNFSFQIWCLLTEGALVASDHSLLQEIVRYCYEFAPAAFLVEYLFTLREALGSAEAIAFLKKRQRRRNISDLDRSKLRLALALSQLKAKQPKFAMESIEVAGHLLTREDVSIADRARITTGAATCHYWLGQNREASLRFEQAASLWAAVGNHYQQCRCLYNAATNLSRATYPSVNGDSARTLELVALASDLARQHEFSTIMAHCLLFEAVTLLNHGQFKKSNDRVRAALALHNAAPGSLRQFYSLHISNFVGMRQWPKAERALQQMKNLFPGTIEAGKVPKVLQSEATLFEQRGHIQDALSFLHDHLKKRSVVAPGFRPAEWLDVEMTYVNLCLDLGLGADNLVDWRAWLDKFEKFPNFKMASTLARILIDQERIGGASSVIDAARRQTDLRPELRNDCEVVWGELLLRQDAKTEEYANWLTRFSATLSLDEGERLMPSLCLFRAALFYRTGDLAQVRNALGQILESQSTTYLQRFLADCWVRHLDGQSVRLPQSQPWKQKALARATKLYFKPTVTSDFELRRIEIGAFSVDLGNRPVLSALVQQIFNLRHEGILLEEVYRRVWGSNSRIVGWEPRLRMALVRLRQQLAATMAPLFYIESNSVYMLPDCFEIKADISHQSTTTQAHLLSMLRAGVWSADELAKMTKVSRATTKRHLKKLVASGRIERARYGRRVVYRLGSRQSLA